VEAYAQKALGNRLTTWKGAPVTYRDGNPGYTSQRTGRWVRIWFPDGPPLYYAETEVPEAEFGADVKGLWDAFERMGRFEGVVPEVPPLRVHCRWDI
jgi:nucleoporin NUP42